MFLAIDQIEIFFTKSLFYLKIASKFKYIQQL